MHFFPPVSLHRGFYYHPYFGFYYGPYYGPFYPYPGPYPAMERFTAVAVRTKVKPVETEVWVNEYFAGLADDFDGLFQRLYLPYGEHEIEFHLEGYRTFSQRLYLTPGDTRELVHQMQRLPAGAVSAVPVAPLAVPGEWMAGATAALGDVPSSPFGILTLSITPADAQIVVDGEVWLRADTRTALVIHVPAGAHQLEVRKAGFQTFRTGIELSPGGTAKLDVHLVP